MCDLQDKINKLRLQAQLSPLGGATCDARLLFDVLDEVEELCDGFYLDLGGEFDDTYLRRKDKFEFLKSLALDYIRKGKQVNLYGFIKTSKGLIYVAKMNSEGDLEVYE